jgi:hypothetical protein
MTSQNPVDQAINRIKAIDLYNPKIGAFNKIVRLGLHCLSPQFQIKAFFTHTQVTELFSIPTSG